MVYGKLGEGAGREFSAMAAHFAERCCCRPAPLLDELSTAETPAESDGKLRLMRFIDRAVGDRIQGGHAR